VKAKTPIPGLVDLKKFVRTDKKHISNSYLSTLKRALIGEPQWYGTEKFLSFGTEHHKRALEPKEAMTRLEKDDDLCTSMASSFRAHPEIKKILRGSRTEVEYNRVYRGVWVKLFVDIEENKDNGHDLKGTSCDNERMFVKKSREFDYFRQSALYMDVCKYKRFQFIGERKEPEEVDRGTPGSYKKIDPLTGQIKYLIHPLFFLPVLDFPIYLSEGRDELHQLIDIHIQLRKHYEKQRN
jgi:hypothetical protein